MIEVFSAFLSFAVILTSFYFLGRFLTSWLNIKLQFQEDLFYSTTLGILVFTLIAYILSWFKLTILILPIIIGASFFVFLRKLLPQFELPKIHRLPLTIVLLFSFIFSLTMLITGRHGNNLIFRHDDTWHLALINELIAHFPPDNPGFAGISLQGYHFFYDFLASRISLDLHISPAPLHFNYLPFLFSLLLGLGVYVFMYRWQKNTFIATAAVFLTMFSGSFAFILPLLGYVNLNIDNGLGMLQPALTLYNPPLAISLIFILFALFTLHAYLETKQKKWLIPLALTAGLLPMFKVYGGIILLIGLFIFTIFSLFKKNYSLLIAFIFSGFIILLTYFVFAGNSGKIEFYPFWAPHNLLQSINLYSFDVKHTGTIRILDLLQRAGLELLGLILFIFGNLGIRLIGLLILLRKNAFSWSFFSVILALIGLISLLLPLFFIQSLKEFEIIQFSAYYLFIASLFAAIGFGKLFAHENKLVYKTAVIIGLMLLALPSATYQYSLFPKTISAGIKIDSPYYQSVLFLAKQTNYNDTVFEIPPRDQLITDPDLTSWYAKSNPNLIAFANKRGFLNNEFIEFPNVNLKSRLELAKQVVNAQKGSAKDMRIMEKNLQDNNIKYLYMPIDISEVTQSPFIHKVFHNDAATIYIVEKNKR